MGFNYFGIVLYFLRRAFRQKRAVFQHIQVVAHTHHQLHIMLDDQNGHAALDDLFHELVEIFLFCGVHPGSRLIQKKQLGIAGQAADDFQKALLSVGKTTRAIHGLFPQTDELQQLIGLALCGRFLATHGGRMNEIAEKAGLKAAVHAHHDVFQHRHLAKQVDDLVGTRNAGLVDLESPFALDMFAVENNSAFRGLVHAADAVKKRCLARSVRADQAGDLPLADVDAYLVDGDQAAKADGNILRPKHAAFPLPPERAHASLCG